MKSLLLHERENAVAPTAGLTLARTAVGIAHGISTAARSSPRPPNWAFSAKAMTSPRIVSSVTEQTVKFHLSNIYRKLGVGNRTEATRYAYRNGLIE